MKWLKHQMLCSKRYFNLSDPSIVFPPVLVVMVGVALLLVVLLMNR